eukprot:6198707-Pleurochrysis_carterae.AAC.2
MRSHLRCAHSRRHSPADRRRLRSNPSPRFCDGVEHSISARLVDNAALPSINTTVFVTFGALADLELVGPKMDSFKGAADYGVPFRREGVSARGTRSVHSGRRPLRRRSGWRLKHQRRRRALLIFFRGHRRRLVGNGSHLLERNV